MGDRIILVDCDGVLADLTTAFCQWHNDIYGTLFLNEQMNDHSFEKSFGITEERAETFFLAIGHGQQALYPYPGARKFIGDLRNIGDVVACTATANAFWSGARALWLEEHVSIDAQDQIICGRKHKKLVCGDLLIDDNPRNLYEFSGSQYKPTVLFDQLYNRSDKTLTRARNYEECVKIAKFIAKAP